MKRSGRTSLVTIVGILIVVVIAALFVLGGESPSSTASRFMSALARGDVQELTELSYMGDIPKDQVAEKWKYSTQVVSPHYFFTWKVISESRQDEETAAVLMGITRNASPDNSAAYEERFGIPLIRKGKGWLVDVRGLARPMYPGLPR